MNIQISHGSHSPNINGDGNNIITGDNNKQKTNTKVAKKKVAEYTIGGMFIALLISFLGSYLVNKCSNPNIQKPSIVQVDS